MTFRFAVSILLRRFTSGRISGVIVWLRIALFTPLQVGLPIFGLAALNIFLLLKTRILLYLMLLLPCLVKVRCKPCQLSRLQFSSYLVSPTSIENQMVNVLFTHFALPAPELWYYRDSADGGETVRVSQAPWKTHNRFFSCNNVVNFGGIRRWWHRDVSVMLGNWNLEIWVYSSLRMQSYSCPQASYVSFISSTYLAFVN